MVISFPFSFQFFTRLAAAFAEEERSGEVPPCLTFLMSQDYCPFREYDPSAACDSTFVGILRVWPIPG